MGCNCGDNEYNISIDNNGSCEPTTPIYNIALGNVGVDGFSPSINIINQTLSSFQLEITDINGRTVTDPIPISDYIEATFAKLASANTFTANNTFNGLTYFNGTMYTDKVYSKTPTTPLIIGGNSSTITLGANTTTANYHGYEIVNTNDLATTLAGYLQIDGSNATLPFAISNFKILSDGSVRVANEDITGYLNVKEIRPRNASGITIGYTTSGSYPINLITNDKAYYNSKEIATVDQIPDISDLVTTTELNNTLADYAETSDIGNGTITINQGGVLKGTFTTNQSGNTTIDLDAGGSSSYTAGTGIDITNDTISIDTDVVAQLSDIPDVSDFVDTTTLTNTLSDYVQTTTLATVATTGSYNNLIDTPTIPTVNNPTITFTQGGVSKGTITLNQSSNQTIALDAGGGGVTNPITLSETVGTNVNTLELGIETDNGNPVLHYERVVNSGGSSYTLNYNLLRYATAKSNGGLKDNWTTDFIGCSGNQLEVKVDNNTIKINGSGEIYADVSSSGGIDADTLNSALKNKEDYFDQVISPLAITYTNGLVDFNGSNCYITSGGILTGDTEWCTVDVSADDTDIVNDYWEFTGEFIYNSVSADESVTSVNAGNAGFVISISSAGNVYNEDDPDVVLANIAANTWTTFRYVHQAGANTVEVTFLNSQGVLETHSTPLDSSITGTLTDFNWRVNTGYGIEFNLASPVCYYSLMPNGEHHGFVYRNLEMPLWYDSTTSTLNIGILQ